MFSRKRTSQQFTFSNQKIDKLLTFMRRFTCNSSEAEPLTKPQISSSHPKSNKSIKQLAIKTKYSDQNINSNLPSSLQGKQKSQEKIAISSTSTQQLPQLHQSTNIKEKSGKDQHQQKVRVYLKDKLVDDSQWLQYLVQQQQDSSEDSDISNILQWSQFIDDQQQNSTNLLEQNVLDQLSDFQDNQDDQESIFSQQGQEIQTIKNVNYQDAFKIPNEQNDKKCT